MILLIVATILFAYIDASIQSESKVPKHTIISTDIDSGCKRFT